MSSTEAPEKHFTTVLTRLPLHTFQPWIFFTRVNDNYYNSSFGDRFIRVWGVIRFTSSFGDCGSLRLAGCFFSNFLRLQILSFSFSPDLIYSNQTFHKTRSLAVPRFFVTLSYIVNAVSYSVNAPKGFARSDLFLQLNTPYSKWIRF